MSTGSAHVELMDNATSESFAEAVERFMHICGVPSTFVSDQGSNFRGYSAELKKFSNLITTHDAFKTHGISWKWVPIGAPHFNGFVERQLGMIKAIIRKSVGKKILTKSQFLTVATYAQAVFNERPLQVMPMSEPNFVPVTPNMLVYGRNLCQFSHDLVDIDLNDPEFSLKNKDFNVMALKLRSTLARVRKLWHEEYFQFLTKKDSNRQKMAPFTKSCIVPKKRRFCSN